MASKYTIAVDIGHNSKPDTGAVSRHGTEDQKTKEVGEELINLLQKAGAKVVRVAPSAPDTVLDSLEQRINKANNEHVDFFVSVHFNSFSNPDSNGTEVLYWDTDDKSKNVAECILNNFADTGFYPRGVKQQNAYVIKHATMPAVLVECAFITNDSDMAKYDPLKMAQNIFLGILEGLE